jgi:hypothetical protein
MRKLPVSVLVVPGKDGVSVMMLECGAGFSVFLRPSGLQRRQTRDWVGPDGVAAQPIVLADDTTVSADLVQNVHAIEDPARAT